MADRWWSGQDDERYWVEITDRDDLGVDLAAPQYNEDGGSYWSYDLVNEVREGDVVLHYFTPHRAYTHWSRAVGRPYADELLWGAHGQASGRGPVDPYRRPAWRLALDGPFPIADPVTLEDLQRSESVVRRVADELRSQHRGLPLYLPWQISDKRDLRAFQGYMTKMPKDLLTALPGFTSFLRLAERSAPSASRPAPRVGRRKLGNAYRRPDEDVATRPDRDPQAVDPDLVDRGLRAHARTQNNLADRVRAAGFVPRSPAPGEPSFDLAWEDGKTICIAEIKSIRSTNQAKQLRLALGQVLHYAHLLKAKQRPIRMFIAAEVKPADDEWQVLCAEHEITLCWPDTFDGAL